MTRPMRVFQGSSWDGETVDDDVAWELNRLRAVGIRRVVAVNLTKEEFGIPVVRIVIPGLEHDAELPNYRHDARAKRLLAEQTFHDLLQRIAASSTDAGTASTTRPGRGSTANRGTSTVAGADHRE